VTNPQGPPNEGPSTWGRPGSQGSFGQPPTERPTEQIDTGDPAQIPPTTPGPAEQPATPHRAARRTRESTAAAGAASAARQPAAPNEKPEPATRKRRWLRDPLSILLICIIVAALVIAGLIGAELYARHTADTKVAEAVACEVKDQATASFGVAPLLLWQFATKHFTNISVSTAGNQIRDAKGMKIDINIKDVRLRDTSTSKGTIGSLDATITWTSDGIKESVQNGIPLLGAFVTNSVTTHPSDGTIELKGMLDDITAKPVVSGTGLQLQIVSFNALGFTLPKETVQSSLDDFTSNLTKNYPLGIHADNVEVTSSGVTSHFSSRNANIPTGNDGQDPCFANI
jgi:hypothetical protein